MKRLLSLGGKLSIFCLSDQLMFNSLLLLPTQVKGRTLINREEDAKVSHIPVAGSKNLDQIQMLLKVIPKGMSDHTIFLTERKEERKQVGCSVTALPGHEGRQGQTLEAKQHL